MPLTNEKPFIMVRSGRFMFNITPRNAAGWRQFAGWMAVFGVMTAALVIYVGDRGDLPEARWATAIYLAALGVWTVAMLRWMRARAEVVDIGKVRHESHKPSRNPRK